MATTNQDLQATHKILQFIEQSKRQGEMILDTIPGIFGILNSEGDILRGNSVLAQHFNQNIEEILYENLSSIFVKEEWQIFQSYMQRVLKDKGSVDFELTISDKENNSHTYLWYLSHFENEKGDLITIVGKDISDLKSAQQNLIEIFSSVPLAIFTILPGGVIAGEVSQYSEVLLGKSELSQQTIDKVLFDHIQSLELQKRETLETFVECIGQNELIFSVIEDELPTRLQYHHNGQSKWLSCTYQPVVYEGITKKALLILQDISSLVKAEELQNAVQELEENSVKRIVQLKRNDEATRDMVVEEVQELLAKAIQAAEEASSQGVCNALHGLKGCARVLGLEYLTEITHATESKILKGMDQGIRIQSFDLIQYLEMIAEECQEVVKLNKAFSSGEEVITPENTRESSPEIKTLFEEYRNYMNQGESVKASFISHQILVTLKYLDMNDFSKVQEFITHSISKTAETLSKDVQLKFLNEGLYLNQDVFETIKSSLIHIVTNAVDHGIETPETRLKSGKDPQGTITIRGWEDARAICINISDDGQGFNLDKIRNALINKQLLSLGVAERLEEDELLNWIFEEQFSSAEQVTEISGRGIGLAAVKDAIEKLGGTIIAQISDTGGSVFKITFPHKYYNSEDKSTFYLSQLINSLQFELGRHSKLGQEPQVKLSEDFQDKETLKVYGNLEKLIFSLSNLILQGKMSDNKTIEVSLTELGLIQVQFEGTYNIENDKDQFFYETAIKYLNEHRGSLEENDTIRIEFGHIIQNK